MVEVAVVEKHNVLKIDLLAPQEITATTQRGILPSYMGKTISIATKIVKKAIDNEQKKYFAQAESGITDLFFYDNVSEKGPIDPYGMQFGGLTIIRTFENRMGGRDTAYIIELEVDTSDVQGIINNGFFYLKVKRVDIRYAEAKVPSARWYYPWTYVEHKKNDEKLNMDIEISITSSNMNGAGEFIADVELGKFFLFMHDIPLHPKMKNYKDYRKKMVGEKLIGKCFLVPRSAGFYMENYGSMKKCYSRGNYDVKVKIMESGSSIFVNKDLFSTPTGTNKGTKN